MPIDQRPAPTRRGLPTILLATLLAACGGGEAGQEESDSAGAPPAVAAGGVNNQLTPEEEAAGWQLLFDGKTLTGWRGLGRDTVPTAHWEVVDGAIRKKPSGQVPVAPDGQPLDGGDLLTERTFTDYELAFEWKVAPGANSGLKYNVSEALSTTHGKHNALGFEYQVIDDGGHPDATAGGGTHAAGGLYDLVAANDRKRVKPVGEWNQSRIVFRGNHGEHWLNGEKVVEYELQTPRMDSLFRASKWKHIPEFIIHKPNHHIVLQDHNDEALYRNIKLRELE